MLCFNLKWQFTYQQKIRLSDEEKESSFYPTQDEIDFGINKFGINIKEKPKAQEKSSSFISNDGASTVDVQDEESRLATQERPSPDDITFIFNIMKKEAPHDLISIRQLFYGMVSTFSKNPYHIMSTLKIQVLANPIC